jgi:hypothetical protein
MLKRWSTLTLVAAAVVLGGGQQCDGGGQKPPPRPTTYDSLTLHHLPVGVLEWDSMRRALDDTVPVGGVRQFCAYYWRQDRIMARSQACPSPPGREVPEVPVIWTIRDNSGGEH